MSLLLTSCKGDSGDSMAITRRLVRLRALMQQAPAVYRAYIVPTADSHQSEYISDHDARRAYISGFTGSAGTALVLAERALLWTDGRYYLQAEAQLTSDWELMKESLPTTPTREKWLVKNLPPKSTVGANPMVMANAEWKTLETALTKAGHSLVPVEKDLVDIVWDELDGDSRPEEPADPIFPLPIRYTGKSVGKKLEEVRASMKEKGAELLVITALDEVAYLLNLRGGDIPYNPVFYAYCCVTATRVSVFLDQARLQEEAAQQLRVELGLEEAEFQPYGDVLQSINRTVRALADARPGPVTVWISGHSSRAVHGAADCCPEVDVLSDITPVCLMKAVKNSVETQGLINCHRRDGAALAMFFAWLEEEMITKERTDITEISAADHLEHLRSQMSDYMGLSFATISASGPNGAVIHYKPQAGADRALSRTEPYLCDSGAQYRDGTTDVTRTVHLGQPSPAQVAAFTLVLRGQVALGTAVFPNKIQGNALDALARRALWQRGLDYAHGTGHGVGAFLNVHEGPAGISWRPMPDDPGLQEGMFLSNEPGFYEDGQYGIRIEDIIRVITLIPPGNITEDMASFPRGLMGNFEGRGALGFQTVTMCPIQKKMINVKMLTDQEIDYLDEYHRKVWKEISPLLLSPESSLALKWLEENTKPLRE